MISQAFFVSKPMKLCVLHTVRIKENRATVNLVHKKDVNIEIHTGSITIGELFSCCVQLFKFHEKDSW